MQERREQSCAGSESGRGGSSRCEAAQRAVCVGRAEYVLSEVTTEQSLDTLLCALLRR